MSISVCEHLVDLRNALLESGASVTFSGKAWSENCRNWVYFDRNIQLAITAKLIGFADCVKEHIHFGTHDGSEKGFICTMCNDGVMGLYDAGQKFPSLS